MIIQENEFLKTYDEMSNLWEDAEPVVINDKPVAFVRNFQSPEQLMNLPARTSGIYLIRYDCPENGPQYYVGKSVDIAHRTKTHFIHCPDRDSTLLHNKIAAHYPQEPERFKIAILEYNSRDKLYEREKHWIETLNTHRTTNKLGGLNLTRGGEGGNGSTITPEMYNSIIDQLENTERTNVDIALEHGIDRKNVYLINHGWHWLSTSDRTYPIRSEEQTTEYSHRATDEARITKAELQQVVCLDRNNNYYYFPNTTKAAEFAVINGFYNNEARARAKIKLRVIEAENLDDFKDKSKNAFVGPGANQRQLYWGILNTVPNKDAVSGGFSGEEITNDQGQAIGIKLA